MASALLRKPDAIRPLRTTTRRFGFRNTITILDAAPGAAAWLAPQRPDAAQRMPGASSGCGTRADGQWSSGVVSAVAEARLLSVSAMRSLSSEMSEDFTT